MDFPLIKMSFLYINQLGVLMFKASVHANFRLVKHFSLVKHKTVRHTTCTCDSIQVELIRVKSPAVLYNSVMSLIKHR